MPTDPDFRLLFESGPGLYLVLHPDLSIAAVSDAYLRATMTTRAAVLGRGLFEVFPDNPDDPAATGVNNLRASIERVLATHQPDAMAVQQYDVRRPDHEGGGFEQRFWSPVNIPVLGSDGALRYILHRAEDVTEFVRLKQRDKEQQQRTGALLERAEAVEAEVYQRAQQLQATNERLRVANDEVRQLNERLRDLDELKTQFFANVSHELRTPLALVLGPLGKWLGADGVPADLRRDLELADRNARLLLKHVNDLLDVVRLEGGTMPLHRANVDLARLVRLAAGNFDGLAAERRMQFTVVAPQRLDAEVDAELVQRVLVNLLGNAFKFTPDGGRVRVALAVVATGAGERGDVAIEVADSGPGIPPAWREAVFERFRQVDGGATRRFGGTGLGLAIVRDFVGLHGGTVHADAAAEGGALLRVVLPGAALPAIPATVAAAATVAAPPGAAPVAASAPAAPANDAGARATVEALRPRAPVAADTSGGDRGRVLVVDDHPDMVRFLAETLAPFYRVDVAMDGAHALGRALQQPPDLVLTDVMMPGMTGDQLVRELRRHSQLDAVPIVLLTAKADDDLRLALLRNGAQDYLLKPFATEELLARVANLVAMKRARDVLQRESRGHLGDLVALAAEVAGHRRELQQALTALQHKDQQLMQAQKLDSLGRMAGSIAHDFNNLLTVILGNSEVLAERLVGDGVSLGYVRELVAAATSSRTLTQQLLAFARKQPIRPRPVNLNDVVQGAQTLLRPLLRGDVRLEVRLADDLGQTLGDPTQFEQVLINLVVNANDAMPAGGTVAVETSNASIDPEDPTAPAVRAGPYTVLSVRDNGVGMPPEVLEHLFEPFFTTKEPGRGTGLGLATCHGIVEQAGGSIDVASLPNEGTTFRVWLPRLRATNVPAAADRLPAR